MLTADEFAVLSGKSYRTIKDQCLKKKLNCTVEYNDRNRPKYYIPVSELNAAAQNRYYAQQAGAVALIATTAPTQTKPLDHFDASERAEIDLWVSLLDQWKAYRGKHSAKSKADVDKAFVAWASLEHENIKISVDILYRKAAALKSGNYSGLVDKRGKWKKGVSETPQEIVQVFYSYYLNESQHPISRCIEYTQLYLQKNAPDLVALMPSYSTMRRKIEELPLPVRVLGREGEKAYYDKCTPYIRREYENIAPNEWWVADTHTFDIISRGENGKTHRIYLNAYMDVRSGIFTGWYVTANPSSDASLLALKYGIEACGIPKHIYVDNGREYLTYDIGGLGHRAKKTTADGKEKIQPPGVYKRLGIEMTNAIVRNARAKIIERRFRDVKDHISRLFMTYTGGTVVEKPDRLKAVLKQSKEAYEYALKHCTEIQCDRVVSDDRFIEIVNTLISGYMNTSAYNGSVSEDQGKRRCDVFAEHYNEMPQRHASAEDLRLLLMRTTRPQKVTRNGVCVKIAGKPIDFYCDEIRILQGKQVYVRYDPAVLDTVRVYDLDDRFLLETPRSSLKSVYGEVNKETITTSMQIIRGAKKLDKERLKLATLPLADEDSALELVMAYAQQNLLNPPQRPAANAIEMVRVNEEPLLQAVGQVDTTRMLRNATKHKMEDDLE